MSDENNNDLTIRPADPVDDPWLVELWTACGLVTAWNPPQEDIDRMRKTGHGTLLVGTDARDTIVASVMVGHDGHRAWLYYLAVAPDHRRRGHGRRMVAAAEAWVSAHGVGKAMLMVRPTNRGVEAFYRALGYELSPVNVLQRWLAPKPVTDGSGKRKVTVTYLEMDARPARLVVAPPSVPHAILRLHEPAPDFYRFMHDTIGRPWLWYERRLIDDAALLAIIHDPAVEIFVLYVRGNPAGFLEIDRRQERVADIRFLGLIDSYTGRGLGRYLLTWGVDQAWQGATDKVTVNTCTLDHPRALTLYQRTGFTPVRRETMVIDDPALILRRLDNAGPDSQ
ncbi:MAG: GNAT family acetyltransferase [Alphaproteobacteria bacterium]